MLACNASKRWSMLPLSFCLRDLFETCARCWRGLRFVPFGTRLNGLLQSVLHLRFKKKSDLAHAKTRQQSFSLSQVMKIFSFQRLRWIISD